MPIGIHVSIAKQMDLAVDRAIELGCSKTFQIFTCSPRRWAASPIDGSEAGRFREKVGRSKFDPVAHMPYMPNLCSSDDHLYSGSIDVLVREIRRCAELGIKGLVVHFGSHSGSSIEEGRARIVTACKKAIEATKACENVRILFENSAGSRNSVGSRFEHIKSTLDSIADDARTGVCLDTCHAFAAGYDLRTPEDVSVALRQFDEAIGLNKLYLIHANDSKAELGRGLDRHEHIGLGKIGDRGFRALLDMKETRALPFILETPIDERRGDKENLDQLKKLAHLGNDP